MNRFARIDELWPETARRMPYEPWRPKPGDRVRIRLNDECPHLYTFAGLAGGPPIYAAGVPHRVEIEDGLTGTVIESKPWAKDEDLHAHVYLVIYDTPIPAPWQNYGQQIGGQAYAAIELEPLDGRATERSSKYERR